MYIEEHNHCFMHYFGVKTLCETLFSPPLMKAGYGTRYFERLRAQPRFEKYIDTATTIEVVSALRDSYRV